MMILTSIIIEILLYFMSLKVIKKYDINNNINNTKKENIINVALIMLVSILLSFKFSDKTYFYYCYLSLYLIITAYIDSKTKLIYSIFNYITMIIGITFIINNGNSIEFNLINVIIYAVIILIFDKMKCFGGGDTELFISISFFMCNNSNKLPLEIMIANVLLSNTVMIIFNFKNINFKKIKLKEHIAFAPSIAVSTMLIILSKM